MAVMGALVIIRANCVLHYFLLPHESLDAFFEVRAQESLQRVAVEANQRFEQRRRQDGSPELFLIGDDLQQDQARDVLVGLVFDHSHLFTRDDHAADVVQRDMPALRCIVEAAIGVLLDQAWFAHALLCSGRLAEL